MDSANKNPGNQLQIEITQEIAQGCYANLAIISHSHAEFIVDFARMLPGMPKAPVVSRIVLAPEHAKRLLNALQENVRNYEQQFGRILLIEETPPTGSTANPFGIPQGNA